MPYKNGTKRWMSRTTVGIVFRLTTKIFWSKPIISAGNLILFLCRKTKIAKLGTETRVDENVEKHDDASTGNIAEKGENSRTTYISDRRAKSGDSMYANSEVLGPRPSMLVE
eukprot:scaffold1336_cov174-Amphora_coffeaeformis.AAC.6